jgi:hypothetical protein
MLCRACGNELIPFEYCPDCDEAIHWRCSICEKENEKSVHSHYLNNQIQRNASMAGAAATVVVSLFQVCLVPC